MLKFHVDLGMWDIIHLLYLFRSYFFICTLNPESLKFYLIISSFMQRYPVFSQVYAVLSKASRLSKDLKFYPRMEVSSKDMKIYLGILSFFYRDWILFKDWGFIQGYQLLSKVWTFIQGYQESALSSLTFEELGSEHSNSEKVTTSRNTFSMW